MASQKTNCAPPPRPQLSETEIIREESGSKGRYVLRRDGAEAELTYSVASPGLIIADHTEVPDAFRGQGVVVHAIDCPALAHYEEQPERWLDLRWQEGTHAAVSTVGLDLTLTNDAGVLGRICTLIGEQKANISDLTFVDRKPDFYRLLIDVELRDAEHLHSVISALDAESDVAAIERFRDPGRAGGGENK